MAAACAASASMTQLPARNGIRARSSARRSRGEAAAHLAEVLLDTTGDDHHDDATGADVRERSADVFVEATVPRDRVVVIDGQHRELHG